MPPKPTKRERKDEAKRRRLEEMKRRQRRARARRLYTWVAVASVIALMAVVIGISRASNKRATTRLKTLATAAGCDAPKTYKSEGATHVSETPPPQYKTNPPNSGNHLNSTLKTGIYAVQPPDGNAVHNLEHGHIEIWHIEGQVSRPILEALAKVVQTNPTHLILAPRATMDNGYKLAFVAWGVIEGCKDPKNPDAVAALATEFIKQNVDKGPERGKPGQAGDLTLPPAATPSPSPTTSPRATTSPRPTSTP